MRKVALVAVDVRSTHNVGAFFRTAEGFGAEIVLVGITPRPSGDSTDERLPHVIKKADQAINKTALGAEQLVRWSYFNTYTEAFSALRTDGFTIVAIEQGDRSVALSEMSMDNDIALVMGPEVEGLSREILDACDTILEIPMSGQKESFNVSVAAGIALYQSRLIP